MVVQQQEETELDWTMEGWSVWAGPNAHSSAVTTHPWSSTEWLSEYRCIDDSMMWNVNSEHEGKENGNKYAEKCTSSSRVVRYMQTREHCINFT